MGFKIFKLCLMQVLRNWTVALKISWFWGAALIVAVSIPFFLADMNSTILQGDTSQFGSGAVTGLAGWLLMLVIFVVLTVGLMSIAIGWHRFVLLGDSGAGKMGFQPLGRVGLYFFQSLKIFLIVLVVGIVFGLLASLLLTAVSGNNILTPNPKPLTVAFQSVLAVLGTWIYVWATLRLGLVLPAAALNQRMSLTESQNETGSVNGAMAVAALLVALLQTIPVAVLDFAVGTATGLTVLLPAAAQIVLAFVNLFVSFGILTVIYGHLVEGRSIDL